MQRSPRWLAMPAAVLVLILAACGGAADPTPEPTVAGPAGAECPDDVTGGRQVSFGNDGKKDLYGVVFGTGDRGLVLGHQNDSSVCGWMFNAKPLAEQGYRVLAFDFGGFGASVDSPPALVANMSAAAAFLRADGVTSIVLIGGSMGGTTAIAAAAVITPPVNAVISLSGPDEFNGVNAIEAAPKLTMPVLYLAGEFESSYADNARAMYEASTKSSARTLAIVPSNSHGIWLIQPGVGDPSAQQSFATFLKTHAPA